MISIIKNLLTKLAKLFSSTLNSSVSDKYSEEQTPKFKVGDIVSFKEKVFQPPYYPYYEQYKNNIYVVVELLEGDHIKLISKDLDFHKNPNGAVHSDELKLFDQIV